MHMLHCFIPLPTPTHAPVFMLSYWGLCRESSIWDLPSVYQRYSGGIEAGFKKKNQWKPAVESLASWWGRPSSETVGNDCGRQWTVDLKSNIPNVYHLVGPFLQGHTDTHWKSSHQRSEDHPGSGKIFPLSPEVPGWKGWVVSLTAGALVKWQIGTSVAVA